MSSGLRFVVLLVCFIAAIQATSAQDQASQEMPAAPVPAQILSAKRVFISNGGEQGQFRMPTDVWYGGGSNRAYNQFYSSLKNWGHYELVSMPADADLVFEIGFTDRTEAQNSTSQFKLVILDSKSSIPLWTIFKYVGPGGRAKTREKSYDAAMNALVEDVKSLASGAPAAADSK